MSDRDASGLEVGQSMQIQLWFKHDDIPEGWFAAGDVGGPFGETSRLIARHGDPDTGRAPDRDAGRDNPRKADDG